MGNFKELNVIDPLKRNVEKDAGAPEYSPMDPPDAFAPPNSEAIPYKDMHPFLQSLMDDHKMVIEEMKKLEEAFNRIREEGVSKSLFEKIADFFRYFDDTVLVHNRREEKDLFRALMPRLLENGEHSTGDTLITSVDMMEDDHVKSLQHATLCFNFLGMATRLPDADSRLVMLDTALEQGKALIELMRLHIFREENITFPQAMKYFSTAELNAMYT